MFFGVCGDGVVIVDVYGDGGGDEVGGGAVVDTVMVLSLEFVS